MERRFGWDTHGLPVEYEIDKTLGITGPQDVMKMGIANYNNECRKIVMRYSGVSFSFMFIFFKLIFLGMGEDDGSFGTLG